MTAIIERDYKMFKGLCVLLVVVLLVSGCAGSGDCTNAETFCGPRPGNDGTKYANDERGWSGWEDCHYEYQVICSPDNAS